MQSRKSVQNTHTSSRIRELHGALVDIIVVMNEPQRDEELIKEAGIALDRALFPLLVGIGKFGPIGVVELANRAGRDHTTVSRQVAKLEQLGLVERHTSSTDRRTRKATITANGKSMTDLLEAARERMARKIFATWEEDEIDKLVLLTRKFADALMSRPTNSDQEIDNENKGSE